MYWVALILLIGCCTPGWSQPQISSAIHFDVSPPLRSIPPAPAQVTPYRNRLPLPLPTSGSQQPDRAIRSSAAPGLAIPATIVNFDGIGDGIAGHVVNVMPPDTNMAVGPNHLVQIVNSDLAIYSKAGVLAAGFPEQINTLWAGFGGGCQLNNDGDPVVRYDAIADRFLISQFSVSSIPFLECVAVSTTPDPTGAYFRYSFSYGNNFNDYPKIGVWPDAYYVTYNMFNAAGTAFLGPKVCALDRTKMLAGLAATQVCFDLAPTVSAPLPADFGGGTLPPVNAPNHMLALGPAANQLSYYDFTVGVPFGTGAALSAPTALSPTPFTLSCAGTGGTCVPQLGTTQKLDTLGDRMMFRFSYRNRGGTESLVANHSVDTTGVGGPTAVRWYELRLAGSVPSIFQQGTYAGPAPDGNSRWMGSIAMDQSGDIGLGYSTSSSTLRPEIRYTGRLVGDPAGQMPQGEGSIVAGNGVQLTGLSRWGDYSSIEIDPSDGCTFWYTNQYIPIDGDFNWRTRIGSFKFPTCGPAVLPDLTITKTHVGNFSQGQVGATYTITATNSGTGPTVGTVTVVDTVPAGLTPTAAAGGGWVCTIVAQVVTCTTSTVEAAGAPFPAITLTVTVAANAPASVINTATVSGGGEANLANDTANDTTTINPVVAGVPDLTITKTHVGAFTQGQVGATYTVTATNSGTGPTVGTVTVVDTVPAGLTPTGAAGTGWTCNIVAQVVTCTSTTVEAAGASFPPITLTVTVSPIAPALVTNTATVSGGGEINLLNDTANDPTTINAAAPDLSITKTHVGAFTQGQIGAIYTITVNNTGTGPTTGITTVVDTLPAGLTYLNGTGGGFTCSAFAQVVTCTNPAAIAAGASSVITLSVNVAANAISPVINTAAVTNPNIVADPDDTVTDPTVIVPPSVLDATYQLRYLANLGQGDSYVNFTNAGTLNGFDPAGRICVNVYTFDPAEELISCCACPVTPNGLNSLSARNDLISNTLTPGVPTSVTVKLLSSLPLPGNTCNAASPTAVNLVRGTRAWATTLHLNTAVTPAAYQQAETPFSVAELSASELSKLTGFCSFIQANGSGFGICKSCRNGALGGGQK